MEYGKMASVNQHLSIIDPAIRNELCEEFSRIKHFKLSNPFQKVSLVEKEWFDGLIGWLQSPEIPHPGKIRVQKLFLNRNFNANLELHKDYEIIDANIWEKLYNIFGCNAKISKYCRRHPITKQLTILMHPIVLSFNILINKVSEEESIKEVVDADWEICMIKESICKKYKIDYGEYSLYQDDKEIPLSKTCGEIKEEKKGPITIQKKIIQPRVLENITDKYSRYPLSKNTNNLPLTIEQKLQNKPSKKSSKITNVVPANRNKNKNQNYHRNIYRYDDSDSSSYEYVDSSPPSVKKPFSRLEGKTGATIINNSKIIKPTAPINNHSAQAESNEQTKKNNNEISRLLMNSKSPSRLRRDENKNDDENEVVISRSISKSNSSTSGFPKPCGLRNLGNTCFFNAAVQCLIRCQPLTSFILSSSCQKQINIYNPLGSKGRIVTAYRNLLQKMSAVKESATTNSNSNQYYSSTYLRYGYSSSYLSSAINPTDLHSVIAQKYPIFEDFGQNDAQELVGSLLDGLHEDLNQAHQAKGNNPPIQLPKDPDSYELYLSKNSSPIMDIFNGKLFHSIKCPLCGHKRVVYDPFMFLSLPIPSNNRSVNTNKYEYTTSRYGYPSHLCSNNNYSSNYSSYKKVTLSDCFDSFTKTEKLDGHNLWKCEGCNKEVNAVVKSGISKMSDILIIHLKRFDGQSYFMKKIETPVEYPDTLDSSFFQDSMNLSSSGIQNSIYPKYNLIGVVFHHGSLSGGHYTSAARDPETGKWYEFNDSSVTKIQKEDVHSSNAYILFYQKC